MKERRGGACSPDTDQSLALTLNHGGCHSTPDLGSEPQGVGSIGAEHHGTFRQGNHSSSSSPPPPPQWCVIRTGSEVQGVHAAVAGVTGWDGGIVFHWECDRSQRCIQGAAVCVSTPAALGVGADARSRRWSTAEP